MANDYKTTDWRDWRVACEAAEQKLAAAEAQIRHVTEYLGKANNRAEAAEQKLARRSLEAQAARDAAESELAQLRERVAEASQLLRLGRSGLVPTAAIVKALEVLGNGQ